MTAPDALPTLDQLLYLSKTDDNGACSLAFECLRTMYASYRGSEQHHLELEHAFQDELLPRTHDLEGLTEDLRPLAKALSLSLLRGGDVSMNDQALLEVTWARGYLESCENAGIQADSALLQPILEKFQASEGSDDGND